MNQHTFCISSIGLGSIPLSLVSVNVFLSVVSSGLGASAGGSCTLVAVSSIFSAHSVVLSSDKRGSDGDNGDGGGVNGL